MAPSEKYFTQELPKSLRTKDGAVLSTIGQVRDYMINVLPPDKAEWACWQRVARLMIGAGNAEGIAEAAETALFLAYRLDLGNSTPPSVDKSRVGFDVD